MSGSLIKSSVVLFLLTLISKLIVVFRDMAMAAVFGASTKSDAYVVAVTILSLVCSASLSGLVVAYIPIVSGKDEKRLNYITNNYITVFSCVTLLLSLISLCYIREIIKAFAPGFSDEAVDQTRLILLITLPFLFFSVPLNISIAYLQNRGSFWYQGFSAVIANSIVIISVLISQRQLSVLAVGYTMSIVLPAVIGLQLARRRGLRVRPEFSVKNQYLQELVMLAIPIFFSHVLIELNGIVDKNFSSQVGTGVVTGMDYANKIANIVVGTAVPAIGTVIFPHMAQQAEKKDGQFANTLGQGLSATMLIAFPLLAGTMILSKPIVNILLLRGNFSFDAAEVTADALFYYAVGILPLGLAHTMNNGFFALKDTKTPISWGAVSTTLNIILDFALVRRFSYRGLAIATSISNYVNVALYIVAMKKKIGGEWMWGFKDSFFKTGAATAAMAGGLLAEMRLLEPWFVAGDNMNMIGCFLLVGSGVMLYGAACLAFRERTMIMITSMAYKKLKSKSARQ